MKITHATWENRNFGHDVYEIALDNEDVKNPQRIIEEIQAQAFHNCYVVLKMPVAHLETLHALQDAGFYFLESQLEIERPVHSYEAPANFSRLFRGMNTEVVPKIEKDWFHVVDCIEQDMFETDRVYLDPLVENTVAHKRYSHWIKDLIHNESAVLWISKNAHTEKKLAFGVFTYDSEKSVAHGLLGGLFDKKNHIGTGGLVIHSTLELLKNLQIKKYKTWVSSNNAAIVRMHLSFGFQIATQNYVLRKIFS